MNRKIAAIFAADIAGYSKLVAEDEEETLRRLASYRAVMDDFIARAGGRIFNTAGDAVLAEFPSAVEAVRCAIDIQESLRTRNMAYPASRQMSFRIGITIGDVVERNGDLLGDGVNIAARLEGIAPVGGICISRTVYEQVANKLSVQFADIGEQQVKNIPNPVHAYKFEMRPDDGRFVAAPVKKPAKTAPASWIVPVAIAAPVVAIAIAAVAYLAGERHNGPMPTPPGASPAMTVARRAGNDRRHNAAGPADAGRGRQNRVPRPALRRHRARQRRCRRPSRQAEALVPESIPVVTDRQRNNIRNEYLAGGRSQGAGDQLRPDRLYLGPSRRRDCKGRRARYLSEARRRPAAAAQMRALCDRQYRRVYRCAAADAAAAVGEARSGDDAAAGRGRHSADTAAGQGDDREELSQRTRAEGAGARSVRRATPSSQIRRAPTRRCAAPWRFAATTPACRA